MKFYIVLMWSNTIFQIKFKIVDKTKSTENVRVIHLWNCWIIVRWKGPAWNVSRLMLFIFSHPSSFRCKFSRSAEISSFPKKMLIKNLLRSSAFTADGKSWGVSGKWKMWRKKTTTQTYYEEMIIKILFRVILVVLLLNRFKLKKYILNRSFS